MRFRDDKPGDLDRARIGVREWRKQHPQGTAEQLVCDLASQFHADYEVVLRGVLFAIDSHDTKITTGISIFGETR
jgi:hypothetical protein